TRAAGRVEGVARQRGDRQRRVSGGTGIEVARIAAIRAADDRSPRIATTRGVRVEVAEPIRLDRLEAVNRAHVHMIEVAVRARRGDPIDELRRVQVPNDQAAAARRGWIRGGVQSLAEVR